MKNKIKIFSIALFLIVLCAIIPIIAFAQNNTDPKLGDRKTVNITWSRTPETGNPKVLSVAKWNWSDVANIDYSRTSNVWDGGSIGTFYLKGETRPWDIATWHTKRFYWSGASDVRRFHGEFTIPDGYNVFDNVMISSVGNYSSLGLNNIIPINDNIYVFIYPKDQEINDSNYLEHLAFWTGTACQEAAKAVNGGEYITFHGISGTQPYDYKDVAGSPIPADNLLSHTDGWYCKALQDNIGYLMEKYPDSKEFVIDLIIEDFAEDGGMDRLDLVFTKTTQTETLTEQTETPSMLYHTVTFNSSGGTITPDSQSVEDGKTASVPQDVLREGYTFIGWFHIDSDNLWNFDTDIVTEDILLYAKWQPLTTEQTAAQTPIISPDPSPPYATNIINVINMPPDSYVAYNDGGAYEVISDEQVPLGEAVQNQNGDWEYVPYPANANIASRYSCCCCCCIILLLILLVLIVIAILLFLFFLAYRKRNNETSVQEIDDQEAEQNIDIEEMKNDEQLP